MTEQNIKTTFCITMPNGDVIIFEADDTHWHQPCWIIPGEDSQGHPTARFMPVQKYGMSQRVEPFDLRRYLCIYPAEPGIEEHYRSLGGQIPRILAEGFQLGRVMAMILSMPIILGSLQAAEINQ